MFKALSVFSQVAKEDSNNRLVTAGHTGAAKAILVITSLCLHVRWHGSQTFTAREVDVFRKETELLVVSQVACLVLGDISWFVSDFPTPDQVFVRAHMVSKLKNYGKSVCLWQ